MHDLAIIIKMDTFEDVQTKIYLYIKIIKKKMLVRIMIEKSTTIYGSLKISSLNTCVLRVFIKCNSLSNAIIFFIYLLSMYRHILFYHQYL